MTSQLQIVENKVQITFFFLKNNYKINITDLISKSYVLSADKKHIHLMLILVIKGRNFKWIQVSWNYIQQKQKFSSMKKHVVNEARKALFGLYTKIRSLDMSIECQLKLFGNLLTLI